MAFSMFDACVPVCTQMLTGLAGVIDKAATQAAAKKFDEAVLLADRLYPDMFTLARQIRQATDFARNAPGRLADVKLPEFPATDDTSFAEVKTRIEKSLAFVKDFAPAQIEGTEARDIKWMAGQREMAFKGKAYLLHFCLPNLFFHTTTAYNILRHRGIEIGKRDFLGTF
ncbi:MAG TPA: DUF1993 domain-containing protein [Acetobacteraceae bacterium]|jgi:uncharacterized protein|nr:DUF1993 domain-containing protein [Acetobacteraceae bacterium]